MGNVEGKAFEGIDARATVVATPVGRRKAASHMDDLPPPDRPIRPPTASEIFLDGTTTHALQTEEAGRAMAFSRSILWLCGAGTVALPFLYSTRSLYWPMVFTVMALGASAGFMRWRMRGGRGYSRTASRVFMCTCALGGLFVQYDLGVFSPAPLFIAVGISFFSQSHDRRFAFGVPILCAIGYPKRLSAPNIVKVLDVGDGAEGAPYIAMELLVGQDLSGCLRQRGQLPLAEVLELVDEVARGLAAAHEAGVVHRDLKPQNIFRAEVGEGGRPVWKILDFGVSKLLDTSATMTNAMMIGTPGYMSPEQAEGRDADLRSDVFALGAVTYRALTGRPPFRGEVPQILFEIAYKSPVRPSDLVTELPSDVEHVLAIALAKRRDDRFPSAPAFAAALRDASRSALDPELRACGATLLAAHPWAPPLGAAAA